MTCDANDHDQQTLHSPPTDQLLATVHDLHPLGGAGHGLAGGPARLGDSINRALLSDAKELQAADILVESNFALSEPTSAEIDDLADEGVVEAARIWEFYTVARLPEREETLLSNIKAIEPGYPFYGEVELASGRNFADVLAPGAVVVDQAVLDRLALEPGDELILGEESLVIADVVTHEPDRPVQFFALEPRIFVAAADLTALDLVQPGSLCDLHDAAQAGRRHPA